LSELGIDFGAAELGCYVELELSGEQKKQTLSIVRERRPRIEKLCARMMAALKMVEVSQGEKKVKEDKLAEILEDFKSVHSEIMTELHAVLTRDQVVKLDVIKKLERRNELEKKAKRPA
jgi:hypothetical protein